MGQAPTIDLVTEEADGTFVLVMLEKGGWNGSRSRLRDLQARINAYLSFALDGQLVQNFPDAEGKPLRIRIECTETPDPVSIEFISKVRQQVLDFGVSLEWVTL